MNTRNELRRFFMPVAILLTLNYGMLNAFAELTRADIIGINAEFSVKEEDGGLNFTGKDAEAFALKKGPEAIPILAALLKGDLSPKTKGKVAFYLGMFKKKQTIQPLIDLIENTVKSPMGPDEQYLLKYSMSGLGFTEQPKAYRYLSSIASGIHWKDKEYNDSAIRQHAVSSIAVTQSKLSLKYLNALRERGPADLIDTIDQWTKSAPTPQSTPITVRETSKACAELSQDAYNTIKKEFIETRFNEDTAERFVKEKGVEVIPILIALLKEDLSPGVKSRVVITLGKYKDPQGVQPLIDLIEKIIKSPVEKDNVKLLGFTMDGLGFLDRPEAFDYLIKLASVEYWKDVTLVPFGPSSGTSTVQGLQFYLRRWAVRGMAIGRYPLSLVYLKKLKESVQEDKDLIKYIDEWTITAKIPRCAEQEVRGIQKAFVE